MKGNLLILGIGNYLMGDEGVGVHFAKMMAQEHWPAGVDIVDGGTAGFKLMEEMEDHPFVILVDATLDGRPAGTIRLIEPHFASDFPSAMSTHEIGLKDLMEGLMLLDRMPKVYLFVVSIEMLQPLSIELSPPVNAALPLLKRQVESLMDRLGVATAEVFD
ncbi:MAG: hydrogenase maturation protease [Cyclobacteriaceae bacterium]|nr:hydrogenase maturation protease [Cyclobacteriaceae bacterium]